MSPSSCRKSSRGVAISAIWSPFGWLPEARTHAELLVTCSEQLTSNGTLLPFKTPLRRGVKLGCGPVAEPPSSVHESAARGFARASEDYERGRPTYPPEALALLTRVLGLEPGRTVLDLAAGTGKLTRALAPTGVRLVAVEPVAAMRAKLAESLPAARVLAGTAERVPLADGSVDAVAVGQAFHWFDGDAALAEIHRVLRPGGRLGLVWNVRDEAVGWLAALTRLVDSHVGTGPTFRSGAWQRAFDSSSLFGPLQAARFPTEQR